MAAIIRRTHGRPAAHRHWTYVAAMAHHRPVSTTGLSRGPVETGREPHRPGSDGYRRIMVAMFAAGMATFVLLYDVQSLLPELVRAYDVSPTRATLALSLTTAALAVSLLVAGPLSEVVGRTRLIHVALWSSAAVALACARRADVGGAAGAADAAGRHPRRAAGRGDGVPARGAALLRPRPRVRPLHRRHRARRHGRPAGDRARRRPRGLAVGARRGGGLRPRQRRPRGVAPARVAPLRPPPRGRPGRARRWRGTPCATAPSWPSTSSAPARWAPWSRCSTPSASGSARRRTACRSAPSAWSTSSTPWAP